MSNTNDTGIRWEEPPATRRSDWPKIVDHLKTRPGSWALVSEDTSRGTPQYLKNKFGADNLEIKAAGIDGSNRVKVYARWVGGAE